MKLINIALVFSISLFSCNDAQHNSPVETPIADQAEQTSFFPVTDFLKGQIADIKKQGINPLKTSIINKRLDSSWLKVEDLNDEFAPFLSPVIDSLNLTGIFSEKKFFDQTINAFTFTYDPIKALPDSFLLKHWDIYIDPELNTVRRIYLLKKMPDHKTLQLTWQTGDFCKLVTISRDTKGNDYIEKDVTIKWRF